MSPCNRFPKLLRQRDAGETEAVDAHLAQCETCAEAWRELAALSVLGQALPDGRPSEARRESVRTRILAQAAAPERRPKGRLIALAAAAAIGAWIIGAQFIAEAPAPIGRITSAPGAVFSVRKTERVEWVALDEGRITIRVPSLPAERRLVVVTDDAEVEVRGTIFTVEADGGHLRAVEVEEGVVEVRPAGAEAIRLKASQRWVTGGFEAQTPREWPPAAQDTPRKEGPDEAVETPPEALQPAADTRPAQPTPRAGGQADRPAGSPPGPAGRIPQPVIDPPAVAESDSRGPDRPVDAGPPPDAGPAPDAALPDAGPSPQTIRFDAGWSALRAGRPADAAPAFAEAAALGGPLTADARWWRAVALGRAGDDPGARAAVLDFLDRHPSSGRRFEASVMLGWLEFAAGRVDAAEAAFTRGAGGKRAPVKASAREGLDAVKAWRAERAE